MSKTKSGINLTGLEALLVAFIILKLTGVIGWSWWWVMAPLWAPVVAVAIFLLVLFIIYIGVTIQ